VNAAGLPQSYMAFSSMAISMMLDFKCIVNPYTVYVDNSAWTGEALSEIAMTRMQKSVQVKFELMQCLAKRNYHSTWQI
jgi:FMN reductase